WVHRLDGSARKSLRQCQGREFHEDAEGRGRLFDELRNVRGCHRRSSQLHRRGLQHTQTTLSARLLEPRAIRGPLRSANGQNCRLILSSPRGALQRLCKNWPKRTRAAPIVITTAWPWETPTASRNSTSILSIRLPARCINRQLVGLGSRRRSSTAWFRSGGWTAC